MICEKEEGGLESERERTPPPPKKKEREKIQQNSVIISLHGDIFISSPLIVSNHSRCVDYRLRVHDVQGTIDIALDLLQGAEVFLICNLKISSFC